MLVNCKTQEPFNEFFKDFQNVPSGNLPKIRSGVNKAPSYLREANKELFDFNEIEQVFQACRKNRFDVDQNAITVCREFKKVKKQSHENFLDSRQYCSLLKIYNDIRGDNQKTGDVIFSDGTGMTFPSWVMRTMFYHPSCEASAFSKSADGRYSLICVESKERFLQQLYLLIGSKNFEFLGLEIDKEKLNDDFCDIFVDAIVKGRKALQFRCAEYLGHMEGDPTTSLSSLPIEGTVNLLKALIQNIDDTNKDFVLRYIPHCNLTTNQYFRENLESIVSDWLRQSDNQLLMVSRLDYLLRNKVELSYMNLSGSSDLLSNGAFELIQKFTSLIKLDLRAIIFSPERFESIGKHLIHIEQLSFGFSPAFSVGQTFSKTCGRDPESMSFLEYIHHSIGFGEHFTYEDFCRLIQFYPNLKLVDIVFDRPESSYEKDVKDAKKFRKKLQNDVKNTHPDLIVNFSRYNKIHQENLKQRAKLATTIKANM